MNTTIQSLTILDFGRANIDLGAVIAPGDLDGQWAVCPFPGYLMELTDGRHVLIDTGPSHRHIQEPMYEFAGSDFHRRLSPQLTEADDPLNRLSELGLSPADIDILVVTHTHFDHAGNVADFAFSEIVIHRDAWKFGLRRHLEGLPGGIPELDVYGNPLNYVLTAGDEELVPGLTLLHTPGHAPGHLSALVHLPETGAIILAVDAIYMSTNRECGNYQVAEDADRAEESARRLIEIADREAALLIYGHDPEQWNTLMRAPERYG